MSSSPVPPSTSADDSAEESVGLRLTPGWIAVGVVAVLLGVTMGFIMSSVWLVR